MQYKKTTNPQTWCLDIFFLLITLSGLYFLFLGVRPLFVPDEGRYAEIAREMVASHDYITPYLNGIKYFEKPVLFYWLGAAAIKLGGLNLWSVRSVNAILGLLGCLLTYFTGRRLYDRATGLFSALILGSSGLYFFMAHTVSLDLPVTVFLSITFYAFLLNIKNPSRLYMWTAAASAALAVLTKGLIGLVFPALVIGAWLTVMNEWRLLKRLYLPSSIFIFLLIATPWHWLVNHRNPEFFYFYFIEQHFLRYTTKEVGHYQPAWFFIPCVILGFFPWITFLPQAIAKQLPSAWKERHQYATSIFLVLWATLIFLFFSFSKSKLIPYILPIFPALALLTGRYLAQRWNQTATRGLKISYYVLALLSTAIAIAIFFSIDQINNTNPANTKFYLYIAISILSIGNISACALIARHTRKALIITMVTAWLFLLSMLATMPSLDTRTILPLATYVKPLLNSQTEVITYNQYYQDLPFYLEQRVSILNWKNEMTYGMAHQNTQEWMLNDETFWKRWNSNKQIYLFISLSELTEWKKRYPTEKIYLVKQTTTTALATNQATQG